MDRKKPSPKVNSSFSNSSLNNNNYSNNGKNGDVYEPQLFSDKTILVTAHSLGIQNITTEACYYLADSVSYKIMEILYTSNIIRHKTKRKRLGTYEVTKALEMMRQTPVYGFSDPSEIKFKKVCVDHKNPIGEPNLGDPKQLVGLRRTLVEAKRFNVFKHQAQLKKFFKHPPAEPKIPTGDPKHPFLDLFVQDDGEMDICKIIESNVYVEQKSTALIQGKWHLSEDLMEMTKQIPWDVCPYFRQIVKTLMSGNKSHIKVAINDLRTNPKIGRVCQYVLNMVAIIVKDVPRDVDLTNAAIDAVRAIHLNRNVDPSGFRSVNRALNGLLKVVIDSRLIPGDDDFLVRIQAAFLISRICNAWVCEVQQKKKMEEYSLKYLLNDKLPPESHYGAVLALISLGDDSADESLWPNSEEYLEVLSSSNPLSPPDIFTLKIYAAFKMAATVTYKRVILLRKNPFFVTDRTILGEFFGDSLTPFRNVVHTLIDGLPVYPQKIRGLVHYAYVKPVLKLKYMKNKTQQKKKRVDLNEVFEPNGISKIRKSISNNPKVFHGQKKKVSFTVARKLPQSCSFNPPTRNKYHFTFISRNSKFYNPLHKFSPAGDLLLKL